MLRILILLFALLVSALPVGAEVRQEERWGGVGRATASGDFTAAGALLRTYRPDNGQAWTQFFCSGTLIAPRAFLTAAHCVLDEQKRLLSEPSDSHVFFQTAGIYEVARIFVPADYREWQHGIRSDIAIIELQRSVAGIDPMPISAKGTPDLGTSVVIVGFGSVKSVWDPEAWNWLSGSKGNTVNLKSGIKRRNKDRVLTTSCPPGLEVPGFFCYGGPAELPKHPHACKGDSGGGLYSEENDTPVVLGIISGSLPAVEGQCSGPQYHINTDVAVHRDWIEEKLSIISGSKTEEEVCGGLSCLSPDSVLLSETDYLIPYTKNDHRSYSFDVPPGIKKLVVTINGQSGDDETLLGGFKLSAEIDPNCEKPVTHAQFMSCEYDNPTGRFELEVRTNEGSGLFQVTATALRVRGEQERTASHKWKRVPAPRANP